MQPAMRPAPVAAEHDDGFQQVALSLDVGWVHVTMSARSRGPWRWA
jgi:hypothetical protein